MSAQHTPGPWRVGDAGATVFGPRTEAPSPTTVATITKGVPSDCQRANARLIAAAPALLSALREIVTIADDDMQFPHRDRDTDDIGIHDLELLRRARAAIQQATGGAS